VGTYSGLPLWNVQQPLHGLAMVQRPGDGLEAGPCV
jgi:hypothetical protein